MIKLVAVDMDGTFLNDQHSYDEALFAKIYPKLIQKGIQFVVASGDQYYKLASFFEKYPEIIYVAENGAYVRSRQQEYFTANFEVQDVQNIIEVLENLGVDYIVCGQKAGYIKKTTNKSYIDLMHHYYQEIRLVDDFNAIDDSILKLSLTCQKDKTQEVIAILRMKIGEMAKLTDSGNGNIDIILPGITKAWGLKRLGEKLGIALSKMVAFGDAENDLEMLKEVGTSYAMANAQEKVKKVAQEVIGSNNESGVLKKLAEIVKE